MPREKESYRDNMERICEKFPNTELLTKQDVQRFIGRNYKTVEKLFTFNKCNMISKAVLAREMS